MLSLCKFYKHVQVPVMAKSDWSVTGHVLFWILELNVYYVESMWRLILERFLRFGLSTLSEASKRTDGRVHGPSTR